MTEKGGKSNSGWVLKRTSEGYEAMEDGWRAGKIYRQRSRYKHGWEDWKRKSYIPCYFIICRGGILVLPDEVRRQHFFSVSSNYTGLFQWFCTFTFIDEAACGEHLCAIRVSWACIRCLERRYIMLEGWRAGVLLILFRAFPMLYTAVAAVYLFTPAISVFTPFFCDNPTSILTLGIVYLMCSQHSSQLETVCGTWCYSQYRDPSEITPQLSYIQ